MSGRSSLHSVLAVALVAACGKSAPPPPEADPAKVIDVAKTLGTNMPGMSTVRNCTDADYPGTVSMTWRSLLLLSGDVPSKEPRDADWINPPELDAMQVRELLEGKDTKVKRRAAAHVLDAKAYLVFKVDVVNAPMALGFKELKIGTVLGRVIRFEKNLTPTCVGMFEFQNDQAKSDWAISVSDKAVIDPAVAKALRDDLAAQYLKNAPQVAAIPPAKT